MMELSDGVCLACEGQPHTCRPDQCKRCGMKTHDGLSYGRCERCVREQFVQEQERLEQERMQARRVAVGLFRRLVREDPKRVSQYERQLLAAWEKELRG